MELTDGCYSEGDSQGLPGSIKQPPCPWDTHYHFSIKTLLPGSFQDEIGKPGTQNPGPGHVFKSMFVPSRTQKNDVMMSRNRHICTKFQENRHIFEVLKKTFSKPGSVTSNLECDVL